MTEPADPRRIVRAVVAAFTRGPAGRRDAGPRWSVRILNAAGRELSLGDFPSPNVAAARIACLAVTVGYPIPVERADAVDVSGSP